MRLRTVDGLILPAPIETATLNISGSMVSIKFQSTRFVNKRSRCW
jgi:hypothetical protein